jgi:hypothetical protein
MQPQIANPGNNDTKIPDELVQRCRKGDQKAQLQVYKGMFINTENYWLTNS